MHSDIFGSLLIGAYVGDGYDFDYYSTQDGLTDNTIFSFTKDPEGIIWCSTFNKRLFSITGKNPVFKPYPFNDELSKISAFFIISNLHIDAHQHFYFAFNNAAGFLSIDAEGKTQNTLRKRSSEDAQVLLLSDSLGGIAFFENKSPKTAPDGMSVTIMGSYEAKNKNKFRIDGTVLSKSRSQYVGYDNILIHQQQGVIRSTELNSQILQSGKVNQQMSWVSTKEDGVLLFRDSFNVSASYLKGKLVTSVFEDHEESLWISTLNHGVFHFDNSRVGSIAEEQKAAVVDMLVDSNHALWISYSYGDVVRYSAGQMKQIKKLPYDSPHIYFLAQ